MSREIHLPASSNDPHRECWDLLPWLVNGRLGAPSRVKVETHLAECPACRDELAQQRQLHGRMASREPAAHSPAASFEKLWSRIEEVDRELEPGTPGDEASAQRASQKRERGQRRAPIARWLVAAVIVQAVALVWLASVLIPGASQNDWAYRTVTSPPTATGAAPRVRVVFTRDAKLADLQQMLERRGLVIVNGPSASEVFILAPAANGAAKTQGLIVEQLRQEPLVRFVEPASSSSP